MLAAYNLKTKNRRIGYSSFLGQRHMLIKQINIRRGHDNPTPSMPKDGASFDKETKLHKIWQIISQYMHIYLVNKSCMNGFTFHTSFNTN